MDDRFSKRVWLITWMMVALWCAFGAGDAVAKEKAKAKPKAKPAPKAEAPAAPTEKPWALRDHWEFNWDKATVFYAIEDAEWSLFLEGTDPLIENAGFRITLADGSTLDEHAFGKASSQRDKFSDSLGTGVVHGSEFPAKDGLTVRHNMSIYRERAFVLIRLEIGNTGDKPIEIAKLSPVTLGPAGLAHLSPDTDVSMRRVKYRGGLPVFDKTAPPVFTMFQDRAHSLCLVLGMLSEGVAASSAEFLRGGEAWQGEAVCVYDPPVRIDPGQKFVSDPVMFCVSVPVPARLDQYYAWTVRSMPQPEMRGEAPRCWVTVENDGTAADLVEAAKKWSAAGVKAALVPGTWEGRPGSLEGSTPAYPKDLGKVASQLEAAGAKPGLTLDPLMTAGGAKEWTVQAADGTTWLNPANEEARKHAVERLKKVAAWGFQFFVLPPSAIPAEALKQFNLTRTQADCLAFSLMVEASGGRVVLPSSAAPLKPDLDVWLEAAAAVGRMAECGVTPGPVRLNVNGVSSLDDALLKALELLRAPLELAGAPSPEIEKQIAQVMAGPWLFGRPVDAAKTAPKIWQVAVRGTEGHRGDVVQMFPGAASWTPADLTLDQEGEVRLWRPADGEFVDVSKDGVPAAQAFTVYGVLPKSPHPTLMGASTGLGLLLDQVSTLTWDEATATLSGKFLGGNRERATAYVCVPDGWSVKSGKVRNGAVPKKEAGGRIAFPVEPGTATPFDFEFAGK